MCQAHRPTTGLADLAGRPPNRPTCPSGRDLPTIDHPINPCHPPKPPSHFLTPSHPTNRSHRPNSSAHFVPSHTPTVPRTAQALPFDNLPSQPVTQPTKQPASSSQSLLLPANTTFRRQRSRRLLLRRRPRLPRQRPTGKRVTRM